MIKKAIYFICLLFLIFFEVNSQSISSSRKSYIRNYSKLAVKQMEQFGIPASIKLAQALLESSNGDSELATEANNHFGIKCHKNWDGRTYHLDDDAPNECFRVYDDAEESYRDHSDFLLNRERYAFLFSLPPNDYRAWAKGLKSAGYATNPAYDKLLIKIIEENRLYRFDQKIKFGQIDTIAPVKVLQAGPEVINPFERQIYITNNREYILARYGETLDQITEDLHLLPWQLTKYNELEPKDSITEGQILYLEPKRRKAAKGVNYHRVREGESLHDIAQMYGVKLNRLRWMNRMGDYEHPRNGRLISLRHRIKK